MRWANNMNELLKELRGIDNKIKALLKIDDFDAKEVTQLVDIREQLLRALLAKVSKKPAFVITSYSIHYTKLYDMRSDSIGMGGFSYVGTKTADSQWQVSKGNNQLVIHYLDAGGKDASRNNFV